MHLPPRLGHSFPDCLLIMYRCLRTNSLHPPPLLYASLALRMFPFQLNGQLFVHRTTGTRYAILVGGSNGYSEFLDLIDGRRYELQ